MAQIPPEPPMGSGLPPNAHTPDKLPDPWLLESEYLLKQLSRIRELVLLIPCTADTYHPINTVVDAVWRLEGAAAFSSSSPSRDGQRLFARKARAVAASASRKRSGGTGGHHLRSHGSP